MSTITLKLDNVDPTYLQQVQYSLSFASEEVESFKITEDGTLVAELSGKAAEGEVRRKIESLLERYAKTEFGFKEVIHFEQKRDLPEIDTWKELKDRKWITEVGQGHVILRGPAANVLRLVDARVERIFAEKFDAEQELYPATILCETLDRVNHFTSFPEHIDFVSHLRRDVDQLKEFSDGCRENGWSPELHDDKMSRVDFAMSPSCCYHCYEGMEDWELDMPGRTITATLHCHRYEAGALKSMARLRAFTMREVVFVGHPKWVREQRAAGLEPLVQWAKDWELDCKVENANDMFFTDDFSVKASFQRQQEGKIELLLTVPCEGRAIACASSNFHSATFGKAFNIKVNKRPATSACLAWGYERWVYALFSQFGMDISKWPEAPRDEYYSMFGKNAV